MPTLLSPADRRLLDRRITEERMTPLDPPFERPEWYWHAMRGNVVPYASVMDANGDVAPRRWVDEIDWAAAAAVRLEDSLGNPIGTASADFEDGFDGCC